ncbi:MAG: hypothetical protein ABIV51_10870 [Saprospiraceae bacterium]
MKSPILKALFPHLISILILVLAAMFYFAPAAFEGKVLSQSDVTQAEGMSREIRQYEVTEGRQILWTNAAFSGMPAYQIYGAEGNPFNFIGSFLLWKIFMLGMTITIPWPLFFAGGLGFYLLGLSLKLDWRLCLFGAISFAIGTTNILWIEGGHVNKVLVLAMLAPTLAAIIWMYRGKLWAGFIFTAIFTSMQVAANHFQVTYYFFLLIGLFVLFQAYDMFKQKQGKTWAAATGLLVLAVGLGFLTNLVKLWTTYEYSQESIRGQSELVSNPEKATAGLTKEYAFGWSMGKLETFTLLAPDYLGGTSSEVFAMDENSKSLGALRGVQGVDPNSLVQFTSKYWGDQPFTGGAFYFGAVLIFLFILSLFSLQGPLRWWNLSALLAMIILGWGRNFPAINYFLFDYFPMFNKFRAVTLTYSVGYVVLVFGAMIGLQAWLSPAMSADKKRKALLYTGIASIGLVALAYIFGQMTGLSGPKDEAMKAYPALLDAVQLDRASARQADIMRAALFILAAFGLLWVSLRSRLKGWIPMTILIALVFADINGINRRYLTDEKYQPKNPSGQVPPRPADVQINTDKELGYRVLDVSGNPFQSAMASYFHLSLGGYHAAKLIRYQEVIEKYLTNPGKYPGVVSMLNTKYFITDANKPEIIKNDLAAGNAWFVPSYQIVKSAQEELDSLANINPKQVAYLQADEQSKLGNLQIQFDSANHIEMTKYIPDHLTYNYEAKTEQLAIFPEIYYPEAKGWQAYVDGKEVSGIIKTNYLLRGLKVPAGKHVLEFKFEPKSYYSGLTYARIGSILLLLLVIGYFISRRNHFDQVFWQDRVNENNELGLALVEGGPSPRPVKAKAEIKAAPVKPKKKK